MTGCRQRTSACDGVDLAAVKRPLRAEIEPMCARCRETFAALGMAVTVVERRVEAVPVAQERRRFRPAWIRNLTGRDETGRLIA